MSSDPLFDLWQLHLVDKAILDIRNLAAALDPGRKLMAEIAKLQEAADEAETVHKSLHAELTDLELTQKGIDDKLKKFDKDLYGGKVVNPREVENLQKEIEILKRQRGELDGRLLELWELLPPAKVRAEEAQSAIAAKKSELAAHQKAVLQKKAELEKAYREAGARRAPAAQKIESGLLARYDAIRQKHDGIGMSRIDKKSCCEACGTLLPRKTVEIAKESRLVTCETCHRILFWSESVA